MADRIYSATDRQVVLAVALALQKHPLMQELPIFEVGTPVGQPPVRVAVQKFRTYSGLELPEPGLTLSVFPTGGYTSTASLENEHYTMGRPDPGEYSDRTRFRLTIQASIIEASFDVPIAVSYSLQESEEYGPFGQRFELVEPANQDEPAEVTGEAIIYVVPSEEMLRDLMTMIRYIVRDIGHFQPYGIRNPSILYTNYPTTSTISQTNPENLVFHRAETVIEFDIYETNLARSNQGLFIVETVKTLLIEDETTEVDFENLVNYFVPPEPEEGEEPWTNSPVRDAVDLYTVIQYPGYTPPTLSITSQTTSEVALTEQTQFTFTVTRIGNLDIISEVNWQVTGTGPLPALAIHFEDLEYPLDSLEFDVGEETQVITFKTAGELSLPADRFFSVSLIRPSEGTEINRGRAIGVILASD